MNRFILLYDANESTLDGPTSNSMREDVKMRFLSSGWDVIEIANGEDWKAISAALVRAKESEKKPVLIYFHTKIGYGSPLVPNHACLKVVLDQASRPHLTFQSAV